jgi:hypothetical protein
VLRDRASSVVHLDLKHPVLRALCASRVHSLHHLGLDADPRGGIQASGGCDILWSRSEGGSERMDQEGDQRHGAGPVDAARGADHPLRRVCAQVASLLTASRCRGVHAQGHSRLSCLRPWPCRASRARSEDGTPSDCEKLEKALAELQLAIEVRGSSPVPAASSGARGRQCAPTTRRGSEASSRSFIASARGNCSSRRRVVARPCGS